VNVAAKPEASDPQPFFEDTRSIYEKLKTNERPWMPHKPAEECPAVIHGLVLELGSYTSAYDDREVVTTARLLTDDNVEWKVVAFHGYLQQEFVRKQPREGDYVAIAYRGLGQAKKGESEPHLYKMAVERNPASPMAAQPTADEQEVETAGAAERPTGPGASDRDDIPFEPTAG